MLRDLIRTMDIGIAAARPAAPKDYSEEQLKLFERLRPFTMTSIERITSLVSAVEYLTANHLEGPILECGACRGGSMMAVALTLIGLGDSSRDLYLLDTYDGMTAPTEMDRDIDGRSAGEILSGAENERSGSAWCGASLDDVRHNLASTGYPAGKIHFVQGRVEDTIPGTLPERLALLRLDTDSYESTLHELDHLYPRLIRNGIVIIDDYGHWDGAKRAVDEYFARREFMPLLQRIDYTGRLMVKTS